MYSSLFAANNGCFDKVPLDKIKLAEEALHRELKTKHTAVIEAINSGGKVSDDHNETVLKVARAVAESYAGEDRK